VSVESRCLGGDEPQDGQEQGAQVAGSKKFYQSKSKSHEHCTVRYYRVFAPHEFPDSKSYK
jgi:hypothetical protein